MKDYEHTNTCLQWDLTMEGKDSIIAAIVFDIYVFLAIKVPTKSGGS